MADVPILAASFHFQEDETGKTRISKTMGYRLMQTMLKSLLQEEIPAFV
jgi:hypothetical protein